MEELKSKNSFPEKIEQSKKIDIENSKTISINYKLEDIVTELDKSLSGFGAFCILIYKKSNQFYRQKYYIYYGSQGNHYGSSEFTKEFIFKTDYLSERTVIVVDGEQDVHDAIKIFLQ